MLELRQVQVSYGRRKVVLHDIDLSVADGEMAVVMGHNGAGKTTLLETIFGRLQPDQGEVRYAGSVLSAGTEQRVSRGMAYSPAGQAVLPGLSVVDNMDIAASVVTTDAAVVRERKETVFKVFPVLRERPTLRAGALSGGQRRMLSVGMALMQGPTTLLLDEPSLGLSPRMVEDLYRAITRTQRELGLTVIAVEQSINPTLLQADRLHILRMGRVVFSGGSEVLHDRQRLWDLL